MPDVDIHELFERFKSGGPLVIPAGPDAARRISERRRSIRLSAAAAAAVVVTASASVVAYDLVSRGHLPDVASSPTPTQTAPPSVAPTETPTPTTSPSPTADGQPTDAITLQLSDVPAGYRYEGDVARGDWSLEFAASTCDPPNLLAGVPQTTAQWEAVFRTGTNPDEYTAIVQRVSDYGVADDAEAYVGAVRRVAQECVRVVGGPTTWTVEYQGFAGDDSLVLGNGGSTYIVVRVADLVTQIWYPETAVVDPVLLGQRAAARMCAGTTAC